MRPEPAYSLFVADLHLTPAQSAITRRFTRFLDEVAPAASALYILGDLFEAWPGDDYLDDPFASRIADALRRLGEQGVHLFLIHGNRDFLIGSGFTRQTGIVLLEESSVIDLHGQPTLLLHGDLLCTDDTRYQQFRRQVRDPAWQHTLLARPLAERLAMARQLREQSETEKQDKREDIMDVNDEAVAAAFRQSGCTRMIHGHTHRPALHRVEIDGQPRERWVLTDWTADKGGYLRCDANGCVAHPFDD